jgi:hypothetical protein
MNDEGSGYARPPKSHRFKAGHSGNPRGRPKGTRNLRTDLAQMLTKRVGIRENGKPRRISRQQAMLLSLFDKAVRGDVKAATSIVNMIMKLEPSSAAQTQTPADMLSDTDKAIIEDYVRRKTIIDEEPKS